MTADMMKGLRQLARRNEALWDGEQLSAASLLALEDQFALESLTTIEQWTSWFAALAWPQQQLPLGHLCLGEGEDPAITWQGGADQAARLLVRNAAALAGLQRWSQWDNGEQQALCEHLGLARTQAETLLQKSYLELSPGLRAPVVDLRWEGAWNLVVSDDPLMLESVSPFARDVAGSIDTYAATLGEKIHGDDDRYRLIPALMQAHPELVGERRQQEQSCGINRDPSGVVVIQAQGLDQASVDPRLRNAVTGLKRRGLTTVICPAQGPVLDALLAVAPGAPEQAWLLIEQASGGAQVLAPSQLFAPGGHRLDLHPHTAEALATHLDRAVHLQTSPALLSCAAWPALRQLRLRASGAPGVLDDQLIAAGYQPALRLLWTEEDEGESWGWDRAPALACVVGGPQALGEISLALWRCLSKAPRRGRG